MKTFWKRYLDASLILKITIALILGIAVGLIFGEQAAVLAPFGDLLLNLLTFLIIPLILFTMMVGINQSSIGDLGRMGGKVFIYYTLSSAFAIIVGLAVASFFQPGTGMQLQGNETFDVPENPGIVSVLLNIVPSNIFTAFTELNLLGIIFTAFAFGIALSYMRQSSEFESLGDHLYKTVTALNELTLLVLKAVLQYVPIGIFAIMAETVGNQGFDTLLSLGEMVLVLYVALIVQILLYTLVLVLFKVKPGQFFKQARTPMLTAFVTQSSSGTLPLTLTAAKNLGLSKSLYGFSLPLGATINMDGAAIRIAVSAVFAANLVGDPLSLSEMLMVVLVGTLASIGTAGVPGAGIVMIATVFVQLGLPMEAVALLTAIDALVGMGCTALNVTGDLVGTTVIDQNEKKRKTA
ncbi:dicarboxylate/amino acid:cation symporter [Microbacterium sp. APC 3898]|uniref:Dicarboxylate/amino acid:cation symporter n=1 Tax=Planococcus notacanthi TaxID=3035188 RepID=A0ABT7ZKN0_9BACL|nr:MULTISPECIES: dicarboxylate/amino acid:cation symporter [Terrabacteria group]MDN3427257.1 dicarboxylate/amino acid:cation symporter [Planococcus sp. APC 4016]MDN3499538.1 dicarboxylate/amino acid:cation symporter [Microbacterium sp. APC 3898]